MLTGLFFASVCGAEFQVNTHTTNDQRNAAIAMDETGNFVVVWSSYLQDGSSNGVFGRLFDPNCGQLSEEFQVNTTSSGNQAEPAVAMDAAAGFIVAWQGPGFIEEDREDIYAQRFDPNGAPAGEEFLVNSYMDDQQLFPCAAMNGNGTFVIVWENNNTPLEGDKAIYGRLYDSNGVGFGAEFLVNAESAVCRYPDVAADVNGNFAVVWMEDKSSNSIMGRLFDPNGEPRTDAFDVSTIGFSSVTKPSIAMDDAGRFVVSWDGDPNLAGMDDIHARLYDANGTPSGEQFLVNTTTTCAQQYPRAAMNGDGEFVIEFIGDEFQINTFELNDQRYPAVAISEAGGFVAVWQSQTQDGSRYGIYARPGPIIGSADFNADGFVDFYDYSILAGEWLRNENPLSADLVDDNTIDEQDLAEFCRQWLSGAED